MKRSKKHRHRSKLPIVVQEVKADKREDISTSHDEQGWLGRAILDAFSAFTASILLLILITWASVSNFWPIVAMERMGTDAGMYYIAHHPASFKNWINTQSLRDLVFLDVDEKSCELYSKENKSDCLLRNPVPARLVADMIKGLSDAGAYMILVDIAPYTNDLDQRVISSSVAGAKYPGQKIGPWILLPKDGRPGDRMDGPVDFYSSEEDVLVWKTALQNNNRLCFVSYLMWTDEDVDDGRLRSFPFATRIKSLGKKSANSDEWVITAPYLASLLSGINSDAQDCHIIKQDELGKRQGSVEGKRDIFYTLPDDMDVMSGLEVGYYYYKASRFAPTQRQGSRFDDPKTFSDVETFKNKIVIIGSGSASAQDWHITPLGPMTGAKIVLNAIRSFQLFSSPHFANSETFINVLFSKLTTTWKPLLVLFFMWLSIHITRSWTKDKSAFIRRSALVLTLVYTLLGLLLIYYCEIWEVEANVTNKQLQFPNVDILTPLILLILDVYAAVVASIVEVIAWGSQAVCGRLSHLVWALSKIIKTEGRR